jgi:aryl-alcohol dehydrogenase-like predicted oxidoreductase
MTGITRRRFVTGTVKVAGASLVAAAASRLVEAATPAANILTRPFGKIGREVTLVGLGGGSRFYEPIRDDETGAELVRYAISKGIAFIETAADYGDNRESERRIGMAMKTLRDKVFLETKIDSRDYDGAMREMELSLKLLETDHVDLMLHHYLKTREDLAKVRTPQGADAAIRKLMDQKVIRHRGFSTHIPALALEAMDALDPEAIQLPLNATRIPDFEAEVLAKAKARSIAVIAMKTCGHGYFLRSNTTTPDRQDQFGAPVDALRDTNIPTHRDYLHYALSLPVATAVVGIDSRATVDGVVANALAFAPLSEPARAALTARCQGFRTTGYWVGERL